jgi:hypothetical protein
MKCDYCGGVHNREHCPNCGALKPPDGANVRRESEAFRLRFFAACGLTAYYVGEGESQKRAQEARTTCER